MTALPLPDLRSRIGQEIALSDWVTVTQEMVNRFADATGDHQFIHVDPERAAQTPFGGPIAHGFLTLSLLAGHFMTHGGAPRLEGARMVVNYGLNRVRFISPVPVGSRLRNRGTLVGVEEGNGYAQLTVANTIEIEGSERPAATAETVMRVYLPEEPKSKTASGRKAQEIKSCKCGCGETVKGRRVFANKEHQILWMSSGGASAMNALMPDEARRLGGAISGAKARDTGKLADAGRKGGRVSHELAQKLRDKRGPDNDMEVDAT